MLDGVTWLVLNIVTGCHGVVLETVSIGVKRADVAV